MAPFLITLAYFNGQVLRNISVFLIFYILYLFSRWNVVSSWHWSKTSEDDICGICQAHFECSCANCPIPGKKCPLGNWFISYLLCYFVYFNLVFGNCLHIFHEHCIVDWIKLQKEKTSSPPQCPLCRQEWTSDV